MHWHVDWRGLGNLSWRERRSHLVALFAFYGRVLAQIEEWSEPHQCRLQIDAADSSQDAVFLHTSNPNATNSPHSFDYVRWEAEAPEYLREFLTDSTWQFDNLDARRFATAAAGLVSLFLGSAAFGYLTVWSGHTYPALLSQGYARALRIVRR